MGGGVDGGVKRSMGEDGGSGGPAHSGRENGGRVQGAGSQGTAGEGGRRATASADARQT